MGNRYKDHRQSRQRSIEESEVYLEEKFLKTKEYLKKHPHSGSAANELYYHYFYKGKFLDHLIELVFSDNIDLVRTALAMLSDIGYMLLQPSDVINLLSKYEDSTIITRLIDYARKCKLSVDEVLIVLNYLHSDDKYINNIAMRFLHGLSPDLLEQVKHRLDKSESRNL